MRKSFKYRIYPSKSQIKKINDILDSCKTLYNNALAERISSYNNYKISLSYNDQYKNISTLNSNKLSFVYSQTYQNVLKTVDKAFSNFFKRVKEKSGKAGFPRFKSKLKSFTFPQCNLYTGGIRLINNNIDVYGIGKIKIVLHRPISGTCKTAQIIKTSTNKYFLVASCEDVATQHLPKTNKEVGIDLGISSFATLDDGTKFHHPKPYKTSKEKLEYLNKKLLRAKEESKNREKIRVSRAKIYEKEENIRKDYQHKLSNKILKEYDKIYIEKLNVKNMLESKKSNKNLNKEIANASWDAFAKMLIYKAVSADKLVIEVKAKNTSKTCSNCKKIKKELCLKDRVFECHACGMTFDRDVNAALNIKRLGISLAFSRSPTL